MMPYQAILQMTVHIQRCEARIDPAFNEWQSELERLNQSDAFRQLQARIVPLIDSSIDQHRGTVFEQTFDRLKKSLDKLDSWLFMKMYHILHLTKEHPGILLPDTEPIVKELDSFCAFLENRYAQYSISRLAQPTVIGMGEGILHDSCVVVPIIDSRRDVGENWGADICTHYDNDPFDYRDTRFLHRDGTPADYGDVVRSLVSIGKSVEFKTAGWKKSDRVALRAAEKISHLYQEHPGCVNGGVSIHPYGKLGRNTGETYWENIRHVLRTLSPLSTPDTKKMKHLDVICIYDLEFPSSPSDFQSDLQPIRKVCDEMGIVISRTKPAPVSRFSGRAATVQPRKSDWDVMACLPGYHLQPNGDIFIQNWVTRQSGAEEGKGERPQPTGRRLFTLT